jgi:glutaminyl-tRNA synthetase
MSSVDYTPAPNFIRNIIEEDNASGKWGGRVVTRFPPEPNGYLHIGHAKSICLNFGLAAEFGGRCHMRFDDTNPVKEDVEYTEAILDDVKWLGFSWGEHLHYASDYFDQLHNFAVELIKKGLAFVDDSSAEEIRAMRGTLTEPGRNSPYRERSIEENLELFTRMKAGEFEDGAKVLRAKIDMASPNMNLRDPTLYRIRRAEHHRTGNKWCIYPMYDFTHCLSDSLEQITHSICTLEFEDNRALYDWVLDNLEVYHPQQIEFARLNLESTVMSKRILLRLVTEKLVNGWDDPRMPTIRGMRRRGYTPAAVRAFCERIGVGKRTSLVPLELLEKAVRDDLNTKAPRVMGVTEPLKVVIDNYPDDLTEEFEAPYYPDDPPKMGYRKVPFCKEIYVERYDFMAEPHKKFWRLAPGREVRLRWAYLVTCTGFETDENGEVTVVHCDYDPATKGGDAPDGRRVKGTIHWVSARHALKAEVRIYDRLFKVEKPSGNSIEEDLNPDSLQIVPEAMVEPSLKAAKTGEHYQFERKGYYFVDPKDSVDGAPIFNRTVTLRDTWAKILKKDQGKKKK